MPRHFSHFIRYILNILLVNVQVQISSDNIQRLYKNCPINYRRKVTLKNQHGNVIAKSGKLWWKILICYLHYFWCMTNLIGKCFNYPLHHSSPSHYLLVIHFDESGDSTDEAHQFAALGHPHPTVPVSAPSRGLKGPKMEYKHNYYRTHTWYTQCIY